MPRKKKEVEEVVEVVEVVEEKVVEEKSSKDSDAKKALKKLIADYKKYNPVKYEAKKEELEAKLNNL